MGGHLLPVLRVERLALLRYIQQFEPTKRLFKNEETSLVFVGFPVASLENLMKKNRFNEITV